MRVAHDGHAYFANGTRWEIPDSLRELCPCEEGTVKVYRSTGKVFIECLDCGADITEPDDPFADRVNAKPAHYPGGPLA